MLTRSVLGWAAAGAVAVGAAVGVAVTRLPAGGAVAGRGVSASSTARSTARPGNPITAQNAVAQSTAQVAGVPNPGDDPRLDAWRIWLKSPNKGLTGPYTFWQILDMKSSFGPMFGMPGHAYEERDSMGNVTRVVWHTLDSSIP